ncbi:hypothetical protein BO82DRAFT_210932 [Aspergillus uvarum CBS 121591]|uniref:Uncharacterized protein n=1 Tax=Aspergillus uvarum CBS 121591 TaxID=1448315 RepID=A0A319CLJ9_9EURO|nr:hypothetical protein BO82DRAFT_210932 [Aspergillus uvarum CBS 121591]PYH84811.1 hypothetical protein BO82DRAFT_210932 [Aspergillus uvarum CBS 121591]
MSTAFPVPDAADAAPAPAPGGKGGKVEFKGRVRSMAFAVVRWCGGAVGSACHKTPVQRSSEPPSVPGVRTGMHQKSTRVQTSTSHQAPAASTEPTPQTPEERTSPHPKPPPVSGCGGDVGVVLLGGRAEVGGCAEGAFWIVAFLRELECLVRGEEGRELWLVTVVGG